MSTSTRRSRVLAGAGAAVVTVGIIAAASFGYDAWRSDDASGEPSSAPTVTSSATETSEPTESPETTEQAPPDDQGSDSDAETGDSDESEDSSDSPGDDAAHDDHGSDADNGPPEWKRVLDGFARDFNQATGSKKKWRQRMSRWVTPHLAEAYKTVDPRLLPNTSIERTEIQSQGSEAVTAVIHYRGIQPVWVHLQPTPDGWRVTEAEPYTGG